MTFDARQFRQALGQFATGITVVTTWNGEEIHGMTANSFTSVSLDPPLVLICIAKENRTLSLIEETGRFAVNVLHEQHESISTHFATAGRKDGPSDASFTGESTSSPIMSDALAWFDCTVWKTYEGGDHIIVVGQVEAFDARGGRPLLFFGGDYKALS